MSYKPPHMTKPATPKNIVLYADDDADDLELVQDAFARYSKNVDVVTVCDGSQALQYLTRLNEDEPKPCLVILDINMPILNGKEVLVKLRQLEHFESTPVVLFTTSSLPQDHSFAKKYNAGFVTKPLDVSQMKVITELFIDHCTDEIKNKIRRHLL
ncbi:MAG: response regulator [Flavisolibacter sp.]